MNLNELLSQGHLVHSYSSVEDIIKRINEKKTLGTPLTILYGETFDDKGHSIDSLKYYFFVSTLSKILKDIYESKTFPIVLIADLGVYRNYPNEIEIFKNLANERKLFAEKIKKIYNCDYEVRLMSEVVATNEFEDRLKKIKEISFSNPDILEMIEKTVPEDRLEMERKRGYVYSFEEITTILGFDLKIGPPREKFYDETANRLSKHFGLDTLLAIYLTPSYPLGLQYSDYLSSSSIKKFGLTPYKVGSGGMTKNRIALNKTTEEEVKELIDKTQISLSPNKPSPILDLIIIAQMAKQHLEETIGDVETIPRNFYSNKIKINDLKELAYKDLKDYILKFF